MSENYTIYLKNFPLPDKKLMAWIDANGLDPNNTPYDAVMEVKDGFLTTEQFQRGEEGEPLFSGNDVALRDRVTVPLVSHVYEHGVTLDSAEKGN